MTEVAQPTDELQTTGSVVDGSREAMVTGTMPGPSSRAAEARPEEATGSDEQFDACVEEIRRLLGSNTFLVLPRLEDLIRRRLGMTPMSAGSAALAGVVGVGIRLALALVAAALAGETGGIPWGRWAVILAFYFWMDATQPFRTPPIDAAPRPWIRRLMEDWTALLPAMTRTSDLQDLAAFARRWFRLPVAAAVGAAVAAVMLLAGWIYSPSAMAELPAGSIVLLTLVLYDFGTALANPMYEVFLARQARYDHHLLWISPADSPAVHKALRTTTAMGLVSGMWITVYLLLALVLVSWGSPLVLPLAVGWIVIGYLFNIGLALADRAAIQRIVERARSRRLEGLQQQIEVFEPRYATLSRQESSQLRDLLLLHDTIRDAPTTPTATHTVMHAMAGLIVPTVLFVVTVLGEVYAERIFDAILP